MLLRAKKSTFPQLAAAAAHDIPVYTNETDEWFPTSQTERAVLRTHVAGCFTSEHWQGVGQGRAGSYLGDGGREWLAAAMMTEALNRCGFAFRVVALHGFIFMAGCVDSLTTAVAVAVAVGAHAGDVAAALAAAAAAAARIRYTSAGARAVRFINGR
eukprot:COSAG02_NODE_1295_length_13400_cov_5.691828_12_plen_157_part_00